MTKDQQEPTQLGLPLPRREALWGLTTSTRAELIDVIGEMLLQAEQDASRGGADDRSSADG